MDFVYKHYIDKELSLLQKLTLIIPTHNRNYYLSRCLWYHAHFPFGEIIIADSSPEEKKVVNRKTVQMTREKFGANIRYLEYEPETEKYGGDIYRKWGDAVQHVNTEYSMVCTDKEFVIPETACKAIDCLLKNHDYTIVDGEYYYIEVNNKDKISYYNARPMQQSLPICEPSISLLLSNVCQSHPLLAVHRSHQQKTIYEQLDKINISTLGFGEITLELLDTLSGKYHHHDMCYICRDLSHNLGWTGVKLSESSYMRYPRIFDYDEFTFKKEYTVLVNLLSEKLKASKLSEHDIERMLNIFVPTYLRERDRYSQPILLKYPHLSIVWKILPTIMKTIAEKMICDIRGATPNRDERHIQKAEIDLIGRIITETRLNYKRDTPIQTSYGENVMESL